MTGDWKEERKIEVNPSWIIQSLVGLIIGIGAWTVNGKLSALENSIAQMRTEDQQGRLERSQIRADMTALEIGLRGDRFTRSDWEEEHAKLEAQLAEIRKSIAELKRAQ